MVVGGKDTAPGRWQSDCRMEGCAVTVTDSKRGMELTTKSQRGQMEKLRRHRPLAQGQQAVRHFAVLF